MIRDSGRMPMTAAERMRRMRQRRKAEREAGEAERARAAQLSPARGYSWPPFQPGHMLSVRSGTYSERLVAPRAEAVLLAARSDPSWPAFLDEPVYAAAVGAWARAEAMVAMYMEYIEQQTPEVWSTEFGEAEEDITGDGTKGGGGSSTRTSRTRKTGPSLEQWRKLEAHASAMRTKLGLDPLARARLGRDIASQQADMAAIMAAMAREDHEDQAAS